MAAAALRHAFLQADVAAAHQTWRSVSGGFRPRWPKLADLMDEAEHDVLAYMTFPVQHRSKLHSVNPLERVNKGARHCLAQAAYRRGRDLSFGSRRHPARPEAAVIRLVGAVLLEINDEWATQNRHMQIEPMSELVPTIEGEAAPTEPPLVPPKAA